MPDHAMPTPVTPEPVAPIVVPSQSQTGWDREAFGWLAAHHTEAEMFLLWDRISRSRSVPLPPDMHAAIEPSYAFGFDTVRIAVRVDWLAPHPSGVERRWGASAEHGVALWLDTQVPVEQLVWAAVRRVISLWRDAWCS